MQIPLLLLYLGARLGTAYQDTEFAPNHDCYIKRDTTSPYISALRHTLKTLEGCVTNQTTANSNREVHVVHIAGPPLHGKRRNRGASPQSRHGQNILLHIKPLSGIPQTSESPAVIILWSAEPTIWSLSTHNLHNSSRYLFVLPKSSRLGNSDSAAIHIKVKKYNNTLMPSELQNLVTWASSKYGAVTSANKLPHSEIVYLQVGIDPSAPVVCRLTDISIGSNSFPGKAFVWQKENASSCSARWSEGYGGKDVHIVEVHEKPLQPIPGQDPSHYRLTITAKKMPPQNKNIDLVLKSPAGTRWTVDISKFKGNLRIISNADVQTVGSYRQTVSMTSETLDETGQRLIDWVADSYGHPVSYTEVNAAENFILYVDGGGNLSFAVNMPDSPNRQQGIPPRPTRPPLTREECRKLVQQSMVITCSDSAMDIVLPKMTLKNRGIERDHLSLQDHHCKPRDNGTHLILSTAYTRCGTLPPVSWGVNKYYNKILVRVDGWNEGQGLESMFDELDGSGSGIDDMQSDDTFFDDEDLHGNQDQSIAVPVSCQIQTKGHKIEFDYKVEIYSDSNYQHLVNQDPMPRFKQEDFIYVQPRAISQHTSLRPLIKNCNVSPSTEVTESSQKLIGLGCVLNSNNLNFTKDGPNGEARFSLKILDYWHDTGGSFFHVVCDLALCTDDENIADIPRCVTQDQYCFINNMALTNDPAALAKTKATASVKMLVFRQGVMPIAHEKPYSEQHTWPPDTALITPSVFSLDEEHLLDKCERIVRVEGLDSGAVVGIAFAAFIIGVLLTAALWYIHTHTGPLGRRNNRPRSAETSGESTPSSTAPITIHQVHRFNPPIAIHNHSPENPIRFSSSHVASSSYA